MKILNLYSGIGGNRKLWQNHEITAIEQDEKIGSIYKENFPTDNLIIADAHQYLLTNFYQYDFIWGSPPCQANSKLIRTGQNQKVRFPDLRIYEEIILLKHNFKGLWVIENVKPYYQPLIPAKSLGRHLFWSNFYIAEFKVPVFKSMFERQNLLAKKELQNWLGIHYDKNIYYGKNHCPTQILRNAIHPKLGEHILNCAITFGSSPTLSA